MYEILVLFVGVRGQAAPPYPQTGRSVRIPMDGSTMSTEWRGLLSLKDQLSRLYKLTSFGDANLSNKIKSLEFGLDIFRIFKFKRLIWITELLNFRFLRLNNFFKKMHHRESQETPSDEAQAQQRRNEAAELFRTRRHVSVEDTISMHSEMALPTSAGGVRSHEEQEESREVDLHNIFLEY